MVNKTTDETQEQVGREGALLAERFFLELHLQEHTYKEREGMSCRGKTLSQDKNFEQIIKNVYDGDIITAAGKAVADWSARLRLQDARWVATSAAMGAASWGIRPIGNPSENVYEIAEKYIKEDLVDLYMSRRPNKNLNLGQLMTQERMSQHWNNFGLSKIISSRFWKEKRRLSKELKLAGYPKHYNEGQGKDNEDILKFAFRKLRYYYSWLREGK